MISAILYRGEEGLNGCRMTGHSGQAEAGRDIVCAAVSILTITCVNSLEKICGVIPRITEENEERGVLAFELPERTEAENEKAQILMSALKQGMSDLAESYPEYVRLSIRTISH